MFVSVSSRCYVDKPFFDSCEPMMDLGFDRVEVWLDEKSDHLKPSTVLADTEDFCRKVQELGKLRVIAFQLAQDLSPADFSAICRLCKNLKTTQLTISSGQHGTPFNEEIDRLKSQTSIASAEGIRLSLKTENGHFTEDPQTAVELCQAVPGLGLTLDLSHYMTGRFSKQSLDPLIPYTNHVHLRDSTPKDFQIPVGLGEVDYHRLIGQLSRVKYARGLSIEMLPELHKDTTRELELRKLRLLLETLL